MERSDVHVGDDRIESTADIARLRLAVSVSPKLSVDEIIRRWASADDPVIVPQRLAMRFQLFSLHARAGAIIAGLAGSDIAEIECFREALSDSVLCT